jgi:hypothetical protein
VLLAPQLARRRGLPHRRQRARASVVMPSPTHSVDALDARCQVVHIGDQLETVQLRRTRAAEAKCGCRPRPPRGCSPGCAGS